MAVEDGRTNFRDIYSFIGDRLYFNRPDIDLKGERYNSALLFGLLTCLVQGKELIVGEPGLGKTTSAEYVTSLFYRVPLGLIWGSEVAGHPEQTEEKIIGRPDLGKLNRGIEAVVWSNFVQLPIKIVDEINRLPETKQSMILDGVDRGNWEYLNEMLINEEFCLFATANYQDRGTNTIVAPLLDRFDVMVESRHPGPNLSFFIGAQEDKDKVLRHPESERALQEVLADKRPYNEKLPEIEAICGRYGEYLKEELGIETPDRNERELMRSQVGELPFDMDAEAFARTVLAELSFCYQYGQKRSDEACEEGCHYTGYLCHAVQNCASNRLPASIQKYSKALAWFLGDDQVDIEHVRVVFPYAMAHRVRWREAYTSKRGREPREDPLPIYLAKQAVAEVFRRYNEQKEEIKNALALAFRILEGEELEPASGDHPIYAEIRKDLGRRVRD